MRGVSQILESKKSKIEDKDTTEVRNYDDALGYIETLASEKSKLKIRDMCDIQKLITKDLLAGKKQWGNIRTIKVEIADANTDKKIDDVPEPHFISELLSDLWKWLDDNIEMNPFVKAFAFHYIAVAIHPFADGNGRTVRLMQYLLLLKNGEQIAKFVPSETTIMATRDRYYSSIRQCKILGSLNPIVEYLAECFTVSVEQAIQDGKKLIKKSIDRKPEARKEKIISFSKQKKEFTLQDILKILPGIPKRTVQRDLENLVKDKKIKAKGHNKARIYNK